MPKLTLYCQGEKDAYYFISFNNHLLNSYNVWGGWVCYLIRDTEGVRMLYVEAKCNDNSGNKNEGTIDIFRQESRESDYDTVLRKIKKQIQVISGLSHRRLEKLVV